MSLSATYLVHSQSGLKETDLKQKIKTKSHLRLE